MGFSIFKRIRNMGKAHLADEAPATEELVIQNVRAGGVIHLRAAGPDMEDMDLTVLARHVYRQGSYEWYELECDKGGEKVWLDVEDDDELEIGLTLRKFKLAELPISKQDLIRFDDEEEGQFSFEGETWYLEDSDSCEFLRGGSPGKAEDLYYWDFEPSGGKKFIGVERWGDSEYIAYYGDMLREDQVTVYSLTSG